MKSLLLSAILLVGAGVLSGCSKADDTSAPAPASTSGKGGAVPLGNNKANATGAPPTVPKSAGTPSTQ